MAIESTKIEMHWNYFLALESDLENLSRYIDFNEKNLPTFSLEIARLLISASSEIDVVCKEICRSINPSSTARNIIEYRNTITQHYSEFSTFRVEMPLHGLHFEPWINWAQDKTPEWWQAHNEIKHQRSISYDQANLKNVLNAVAALYVSCVYLYFDKSISGKLQPIPKFLRPNEMFINGFNFYGLDPGIQYKLS